MSPEVNIVFDSSGQMIEFPPAVLRRHTGVNFRVKVSLDYLNEQRKQFLRYLEETKTNIAKVDAVYTCFLGADYTTLKTEIDDAIKFIDHDDFFENTALTSAIDTHNPSHIPLKQYLRNILDSQFTIKVYNGSKLVWEEPLTLDIKYVDKKGGFMYFEGENYFRGRNAKNLTASFSVRDQYKFRLLFRNPFNAILVNLYRDEWQKANANFDEAKAALLNIGVDANYATNLASIKKIAPWFVNWLWYAKGNLTINPFNIYTDALIKTKTDNIAQLQADMSALQQQKDFTDSIITHLKKKESNIAVLERMQTKSYDLAALIKKDSSDIKDAQKDLADKVPDLKGLSQVASYYEGHLFTSVTGQVNVMKQFNASLDYTPVYKRSRPIYPGRWSKERVTEVPENEKVYLIVQNVPPSIKLKFDEKRLDYDDQEEFTKQVTEQLSKIDFSAVSGSLLNFSSFFKALNEPSNPFGGAPILKALDCTTDSHLREMLNQLNAQLTQMQFLPDAGVLAFKENTTPAYASFMSPATQFEAPYRDSITIKDITKSETKDVAKSFIKVGALRHTEIAAGISFVRKPVTTTSIDTAGNGFKVSSTDNASNAIAGFKIYPFRDYRRDNGIIPRYPFRRISAFGGFDILHPLNNFYLGGSYDVVPGLSFIVGNNYYKQSTYTVANNQVVSTKNRYVSGGLFYSVTVNPILFAQVIKTFFK